jgi:MEMO1 family protein
MTVRDPAVAGLFYDADPAVLGRQVDAFLGAAALPRAPALGLLVPHAGYIYSGAVAGEVYGRVDVPARVIVLGPNHTGLGHAAAALWPAGAWRSPLGDVPIDAELAADLAAAPGVAPDAVAHLREHSLEVHLPFLQRARPDVAVAPLCLSHLGWRACEALGEAVARTARARGALIVASSDMSHYLPAKRAEVVDRRALERVLALDPEGLYRVVHAESISMCGIIPATVMLVAARALGARRAELVRWAHSGMVNGDDDRVVGYAGVIVS